MALAVFNTWVAAGKPLTPAQPIREFVEALKVAFPAAARAGMFSWYADDAHYMTNYPEDHTPFSLTGWPLPNPQWWVCATDVGHRPDLGVDIAVLGAYWLAEAGAGRMPWLKYMIWQGQLYDVRNNWQPTANSDDPGHIHLSSRTDHLQTSLGDWNVTPHGVRGDSDMPRMFKITDGASAGLIGISNGPTWYHIPGGPASDPGLFVRACTGLWGIADADIVEVSEAWLPGFGVEVPWPGLPGGGGDSGGGSGGPSVAEIAAAVRPVVRSELDATKLGH